MLDSFHVPVGPTPRELVWSLNKTRLYRYQPTRPVDPATRKPVPLLVYALINKPYIFDLRPGSSIMERVSSPDKQLEIIPAGHVGLMGGRNARYKTWPKLADWLAQRSR